jgi:diguanylate cyclase (GGDEF)-like protein
VLAAATLLAVGAADFLAIERMSFTLFYLVPIALVSWRAGRKSGMFVSVVSTLVWIVANPSTYGFLSSTLLAWNAITRTGFFFITALLISELHQRLHHEQQLAHTDFLTGALNRLAFFNIATVEIERSTRFDHGLSMVYIDLDNFKAINDAHGHDVGDRLLKEVATTISANIRGIDTMARLGGDEFVVLLPQTNEAAAATMATRLRQALLATMQFNAWPVTFSLGVYTSLQAPHSVNELLKRSDELMYRAKSGGKNAIARAVGGV